MLLSFICSTQQTRSSRLKIARTTIIIATITFGTILNSETHTITLLLHFLFWIHILPTNLFWVKRMLIECPLCCCIFIPLLFNVFNFIPSPPDRQHINSHELWYKILKHFSMCFFFVSSSYISIYLSTTNISHDTLLLPNWVYRVLK